MADSLHLALESLKALPAAEQPITGLPDVAENLTAFLAAAGETKAAREQVFAQIARIVLHRLDNLGTSGELPVPSGKPSPEIMEWARQQNSPEELIALFREMRKTGGLELSEFIADLEAEANRP